MGRTKVKGDIGEISIMNNLIKKGIKVAIPFGEDHKYDLIIDNNNKLERIQCKYTESNGEIINIKCRSTSKNIAYKYTDKDIDYIACYDKTTDECYYIPSSVFKNGRSTFSLRITLPKNKQKNNINLACEYLDL